MGMRIAAVGIDPGKAGALVAIDRVGQPFVVVRTKDLLRKTGKGAKQEYNEGAMYAVLSDLKRRIPEDALVLVVLEAQSARPGQGVTSMYSVGLGIGIWRGMLAALGLPYEVVHPATWSAVVLKGAPGEGKARSLGVASRRLPKLVLVPPGCKKEDDGIADAGCLALYALHRLGTSVATSVSVVRKSPPPPPRRKGVR